MALIRLIAIVAVFGSMTLLVIQNLSPSLPLIFLGMRSQPLPLAIWVLLSIVTGAVTSLAISSLFRFSNYMAEGKQKSSVSRNAASPKVASVPRTSTSYQPNRTVVTDSNYQRDIPEEQQRDRAANSAKYRANDFDDRVDEDLDDWEQTGSEDWDFDDQPQPIRDTPKGSSTKRDRNKDTSRDDEFAENMFEVDDQPKAKQQRQDSTYSYNYREPKQTGVGKTESVYDADYRVLVPPYHPEFSESPEPQPQPESNQSSNNSDDDWEFLDELETEDTKNSQVNDRKVSDRD